MTRSFVSKDGCQERIKPVTKVMTRYTPNSGSGLQDT